VSYSSDRFRDVVVEVTMRSINLRLSLVVLVASLSVMSNSVPTLAYASSRQAGENAFWLTPDVNGANPCTGEGVSGSLTVLLVVSRISTGDGGVHVNVHGSFHAQLTGSLGTTYQVSANGNAQSHSVADYYDFSFSVEAISHGAAPNFTLEGVARVFVNGSGDPVGATIVSLTPNCS
jgi:hypothetical protein